MCAFCHHVQQAPPLSPPHELVAPVPEEEEEDWSLFHAGASLISSRLWCWILLATILADLFLWPFFIRSRAVRLRWWVVSPCCEMS